MKQKYENKSETCNQIPGYWGIKREEYEHVEDQRWQSWGGPLTLAGDLEEAGVPQSLDGKWMKDAKSKN